MDFTVSDFSIPDHPASALLSDSASNTITYVFADISWKQVFRCFMPAKNFSFFPTQTKLELFLEKTNVLSSSDKNPNIELFFFRADPPKEYLDFSKENRIKLIVIEPGFIRSVDNKPSCAPISLISNPLYSFIDSSHESLLDRTLLEFNFEKNPDLLSRSQKNIEYILNKKISMYNNTHQKESVYPEKTSHRILVVEERISSRLSHVNYDKYFSSMNMLKIARIENPNAQIIYKPHPGNDIQSIEIVNQEKEQILLYADVVLAKDLNIFSVLAGIDHVYTCTSHVGFEALLTGIQVSVFGKPWYAGWGLTDDRMKLNKKRRVLTLPQLFAGAYILHTQYFDHLYKTEISIEQALSRILQDRDTIMKLEKEEFLLQEANQKIKGLNLAAALTCLQHAIIELPKSSKIRSALSDLYSRTGDFNQSIQTLDSAIELDPTNSQLYLSRARARLKNGEFSEQTVADFHQAIDYSKSKNDILYEYFNYLWEKEPITETLMKEFDAALEQTPALQKNSKPYGKLLLLKASMLVETGQRSTATKLHKQALALGAADTNLLALRHTVRKLGNTKAATDAEMSGFEKLIGYKNRFKELVLRANGSVCIVGNAPTLVGKGLGSVIDNNQLVIRFNSYNTDYPYSEDYGVKTDIWVRMPFHPYVRREPESSLKLVIFTGSNRLYRSYTEWAGVLEYVESGLPVQFFPPNEFYELQKILGAPPTAGLMLCYMLYKIVGPLRPEHYYGFSFTEEQSEPLAYHYSDQNAKSSSRHHWDKEAAFFQTIKADPNADIISPRSMLLSRVETKTSTATPLPLPKQAELVPETSIISSPSDSVGTTSKQTGAPHFDRVISVSPGLLDYEIYGSKVESLSGAKTERHLQWLKDPNQGQAAELLQSITPDQKVCVLGFGRAKTGLLAEKLAQALNAEFRLAEYGLISSMHLPSEKKFNFSLILDSQGIFYDTTAPSEIESILLQSDDILNPDSATRAQKTMQLLVANNITKYNNSPDIQLPTKGSGIHRILVIDQTAGDNSIVYGQCQRYSFRDMLQHALARDNSEVILKIHPETAAGAKDGNLTEIADLLDHPRLHVINQQCNIVSLIKQVDEVYVMTSGVGLEALIVGKPVRCFGVPFYSGWGLTTDMSSVPNPRRPLTIHALFAATFFKYNYFYHPESQMPCTIEECLQWIVANKPSLPVINMEWSK